MLSQTLKMFSRWVLFCLVSLCSASSEESGLVSFGEIFASWSALVMLLMVIVALNYFERVRQPPVPILEKYTKNIVIPPHVVAKVEELTHKGKVAIFTWAIELPYVGKMIKGSGEMKPLKHDTRVEKLPASIDEGGNAQPRDDDYRDMIIGAPLDEDDSGVSSPRTSPKSPPLVVIKTMIDDGKK